MLGAALVYILYIILMEWAARAALYKNRLSICPHPMPDDQFVWNRCAHDTCHWCDAMADWQRTEHVSHPHPYRSPAQENR